MSQLAVDLRRSLAALRDWAALAVGEDLAGQVLDPAEDLDLAE